MRQCDMKWRTGSYYHKGNSKLCFGPTKSLLSDRNRLALPHGRGNFSKVGIPAEKTENENFKGNETRHGKKNGKKAQE
jgi:hypothetical protein